MQRYRRLLRRRAIFAFIDGLIVLLVLLTLLLVRKTAPTSGVISYIKTPGHILVQLAEAPGPGRTETHAVPVWTLYGDGTLIFQKDPGDTLWRAQLTPDLVQHILEVIINQDHFFATSEQRYGRLSHRNDDNELFLTVDANGQQKEVLLVGEPPISRATDIQSTQVFAIEQFLLAYRPLHALYYAPNNDPDREMGLRVALLS
jgi:hypothetical protein